MTLTDFLQPPAVDLVKEYFTVDDDGSPRFTGSMFDRLGPGVPDHVDRVTADDLVAVTMLSVVVPPRPTIAILGRRSAEITRALADIPADVDLHECDVSLVSPGSPAHRLWTLFESLDGVGWVTAGKLLARKRPRLIPVYDAVIREAVGAPKNFWIWLHQALRDRQLVEQIDALRSEAEVEDLSPLRTLDVAIWMRNHGAHYARSPSVVAVQPIHLAV